MTQRLNITSIVDLTVKSGKVDASSLRKELPKLLKNAIGNAPGGKAIISQDFEVDPKLDAGKLKKQMERLVNSEAFKNAAPTPAFQLLEKEITKVGRALDRIQNTSASYKPNKAVIDFVNKLKTGEASLSDANKELLGQVEKYRAHYKGLGEVWRQVSKEFTNIYDKAISPEVASNIERKTKQITRANKELDGLIAKREALTKKGADGGKIDKQIGIKQKSVEALKGELNNLKNATPNNLGASIIPVVSQISQRIGNLVNVIDQANRENDRNIKQRQKSIDVGEKNNKILESYLPSGNTKKDVKSLNDRQLADLRSLVIKERNRVKEDLAKDGRVVKSNKDFVRLGNTLSVVGLEQKSRTKQSSLFNKVERSLALSEQANKFVSYFLGGKTSAKAVGRLSDREIKDVVKVANSERTNLLNRAKQTGEEIKNNPLYQQSNKLLEALNKEVETRKQRSLLTKEASNLERSLKSTNSALQRLLSSGTLTKESLKGVGVTSLSIAKDVVAAQKRSLLSDINNPNTPSTFTDSAFRKTKESERLIAEALSSIKKSEAESKKSQEVLRPLTGLLSGRNNLYSESVRKGIDNKNLKDINPSDITLAKQQIKSSLDSINQIKKHQKAWESLSEEQRKTLNKMIDELNSDKKAIRKLAKNSSNKSIVAASQVDYGKSVFLRNKNNLSNLKPEDIPSVKAYLKQAIEQEKLNAATASSTKKFNSANKAAHKYSQALYEIGKAGRFTHPIMSQITGLLRQFTRYALGYGALYQFTAAIRAMSTAAIDLEDNLKTIQAVTGSTNTEMLSMSESIKHISETTAFDLNDISNAVKTLAQAGVGLKDIPNAAQAVANLATATGASLTTAADILTTAKVLWNDVGFETISDRLTQTANISKLAVEDLKSIFSLGASFARSSNIGLDQFLGVAATLRNSGVRQSTIGTGSSQLFRELFSPDKKLTEFLTKQYASIGEKVTAGQAKSKFQSFKLDSNPILSALTELKRINVDSVASLGELQRSIDKRAFNVLLPLLRNINQLPENIAGIRAAPTAQQAAQVAMDSLKKSANNLADTFKALSSTLGDDVLPPLADAFRSLADSVHHLNRVVSSAQRSTTGTNPGFSITAALAGAGYGFKSGHSIGGKVGRAVTFGALSGTGAFAADVYAKNNLQGDNLSTINKVESTISAAGTAALVGTALVSLWKKLVGGLSSKSADFAKGIIGSLTSKTAFSSLLSKLPKTPSSLKFALVLGMGELAVMLYDKLFSGAKEELSKVQLEKTKANRLAVKRLLDLNQKQAEQSVEKNSSLKSLKPFLPPAPGKELTSNTLYGNAVLAQENISKFREKVSSLLGVTIQESQTSLLLSLANDLRTNGAVVGRERNKLKKKLADAFGSTVTVTEDQASEIIKTVGELQGSAIAIPKELSRMYSRLVQDIPKPGTIEEKILKIVSELAGSSSEIENMLVTGEGSLSLGLSVIRKISEEAVKIRRKSEEGGQLALKQIKDQIIFVSSLGKDEKAVKIAATRGLIQKIKEGKATFGEGFANALIPILEDILNQADVQLKAKQSAVRFNKKLDGVGAGRYSALKKAVVEPTVKRSEVAPILDLVKQQVAKNESKLLTTDSKKISVLVGKMNQAAELLKGIPNKNPQQKDLEALIQQQKPILSALINSANNSRDLLNKESLSGKATSSLSNYESGFIGAVKTGLIRKGSKGIDFGRNSKGVQTFLDRINIEKQSKQNKDKTFVASQQYIDNLQKIAEAEKQKTLLQDKNPSALLSSSSSNPANIIKRLTTQNMQEEIAFYQRNAKDLKTRKDLVEKQIGLDKYLFSQEQEREKLAKTVSSKNLKLQLSKLEGNIGAVERGRTKSLDKGNLLSVQRADSKLLELQSKKYALEQAIVVQTTVESEQSKALTDLNNKYLSELDRKLKAQEKATNELLNKQDKIKSNSLSEFISKAGKTRSYLISQGKFSDLEVTNQEILGLLQKRKAIEEQIASRTQDELDRKSKLEKIEADYLKKKQEILDASSIIAAIENHVKDQTSKSFVPKGVPESQARSIRLQRELRGQATPLNEQIGKLGRDFNANVEGIKLLTKLRESLINKRSKTSDFNQQNIFDERIKQASEALIRLNKGAIIAAEGLKNHSTTLSQQISQVSIGSIAAKIEASSSNLKNFSKTFEDNVAKAFENVTSTISKATTNLVFDFVGLGSKSNEVTSELNNLLDSQSKYNDVVIGGLAVAQQINSIKQNETDPARQDYLIKRALEAQKRKEAIALQGVSNAQSQLDTAKNKNGLVQQIGGIGLGLAKDTFSSGLQGVLNNSFTSLFNGGELGRDPKNAVWTRSADGIPNFGAGGGAGKGGEANSGGLFGGIGGFFSGLFGGKDKTKSKSDKVLPKLADSVDGLDKAVKSDSLFKGASQQLGDTFDTSINKLTGSFNSFIGNLGALFGVQRAAAGKVSGLQIAQMVVGLASSALGAYKKAAGGGYITGAGTSTSDSIPALLSNGEYVINAKSVRAIGKTTLDRINFSAQSPLAFAKGGLVPSLSRQVSPQPSSSPTASGGNNGIRVVLVDDQRDVKNYITSSQGEKTLVDFVRKNKLSLKRILS